jgi:hypothetical protein
MPEGNGPRRKPRRIAGIIKRMLKKNGARIRNGFIWPMILSRRVESSSVVGSGTMLQAGRSWVQFSDEITGFFNLPIPSSRTVALGSTQPLTEMNTRNLSGDVRLTTSPPSVSRQSKNVGTSTSHNVIVLHGILKG